jgi:hypothetical protein
MRDFLTLRLLIKLHNPHVQLFSTFYILMPERNDIPVTQNSYDLHIQMWFAATWEIWWHYPWGGQQILMNFLIRMKNCGSEVSK